MRIAPLPSTVQNQSKTPPTPTVWRMWADSLGLRSAEPITYRKGMRFTAAVEAILSCAEQNRDYNPVSALLRGPDYDIEADVQCVLEAAVDRGYSRITILNIGFPVFTTRPYHDDENFSSLTPVTAICSLRLDSIGVGQLGNGLPSYDNLIHTWEIVSIHSVPSIVERPRDGVFSPRHSFRPEPVEEATLELLAELEQTLHVAIKHTLVKKFGEGERGWWQQGIPEKVPVECAQARERDQEDYCDIYQYTTLIYLWDVLDKQWPLFEQVLPADVFRNKQVLQRDLLRLNGIRNRIMHPIRRWMPDEDDFDFVKGMHRRLNLARLFRPA